MNKEKATQRIGGPMSKKGIVIRVRPHHAETLRTLWRRMGELKILPDKSLNDALYNELQNIELRWQDSINEAT